MSQFLSAVETAKWTRFGTMIDDDLLFQSYVSWMAPWALMVLRTSLLAALWVLAASSAVLFLAPVETDRPKFAPINIVRLRVPKVFLRVAGRP